jgi:O-antigen/teichoic acid export membrane protein
VMCALLMFPIVPVVVRFAEPLIASIFGEAYRSAAAVTQMYMLVVIRECFDFSPPLRSLGRTAPIVYGTMTGLVAAAAAVWFLVPRMGIAGAMASFAIGSYVEVLLLSVSVMKLHGVGPRQLADWPSIGKLALCAALASLLIVPGFWESRLGIAGIVLASAVFAIAYALLVWSLRIPESRSLVRWIAARGKVGRT